MHSAAESWHRPHTRVDPRDVVALLGVQSTYWLRIYPQARRELATWERRARDIPPSALREHAVAKLTAERLNAEGAALFAVLAPREPRRRVVSLLVAYQVLYDFLDAVNEDPAWAELPRGLELHRALTDAVRPDRPASPRYLRRADRREAGSEEYLRALTHECRRILLTLPAAACSMPVLEHAAERCAQAQSHNHAMPVSGDSRLIEWSQRRAAEHGDRPWWELAAGGVSSLAVHALLACAADPTSTLEDAREVDAAYYPPICALSSLLDSLADYYRDAGTGNHSFISRYRDADHAAERLVAIAAEAAERVASLRKPRAHAIILAGIVAYYLSSPSVRDGFPAAAAESLIRYIGPLVAPMHSAMRARRYLHTGRGSPGSPRVWERASSGRDVPGYS